MYSLWRWNREKERRYRTESALQDARLRNMSEERARYDFLERNSAGDVLMKHDCTTCAEAPHGLACVGCAEEDHWRLSPLIKEGDDMNG